jgi:hypothetical protein
MNELNKMVDGVLVPLTEEEVLEFLQREADHEVEQAAAALMQYKELRKREYPSLDDLVVAIIEKEEGRPEALNALMLQRLQIKNKYPKPV